MERFTLSLMLFTIAFRNLVELSGSEFDFSEGVVLPLSFGWWKGGNLLWTILYVSLGAVGIIEETNLYSFIISL